MLCSGGARAQEPQRPSHPFDREWLIQHARELSRQPYREERIAQSNPLAKLSYDDYRRIRFNRHAAIWAGQQRNFMLDLFHPGFLFTNPVDINLVVGGISRRVLYTSEVFNYEEEVAAARHATASGYSGFRINHPINRADYYDEFLVFQGASYFRAVGQHQRYGLSARGLAINTARAEGEEFPRFTQFWIERPVVGAENIVVHALLDSPSVTGAYRFSAAPGSTTVIDVDAVLYTRRKLTAYGLAPLTSMFLFDAMANQRFDDYRPAVHDSEGLAVQMANGERIWRPLANPRDLQVSSFMATNPRGFGLLQRHREFGQFNDNEARYELRPSLWIEPRDDWGTGQVELIEIPADREIYDNIVAYWRPDSAIPAGQRSEFRYRMYWGEGTPLKKRAGRIVETSAGKTLENDLRLFVIDYQADRNPEQDIAIDAHTSAGKISDVRGHYVSALKRYRLYLKLDPADTRLAELQVRLKHKDQPWGETWLYRWTR